MTFEEIFFTWFHAINWSAFMASVVSSCLFFTVSVLAVIFISWHYEEFASAMGIFTNASLAILIPAILIAIWVFTPMIFWGTLAGLGKVTFDAMDWWYSEGRRERDETLQRFLTVPLT